MDEQKQVEDSKDERFLIWTHRINYHLALNQDDSEDPVEAFNKARDDGRLEKALSDISGPEDIDIEVYAEGVHHEPTALVIHSTEDRVTEISSLISRIKHVHRKSKKLHQTVDGNIPCPVCGKFLHYFIDGYSWHSRGICVTKGCIDWRE